MYNKELIKDLFKQIGIKIEIEETKNINGFCLKVDNGKNVYFWDNEIVSKKDFEENIKKVLTK